MLLGLVRWRLVHREAALPHLLRVGRLRPELLRPHAVPDTRLGPRRLLPAPRPRHLARLLRMRTGRVPELVLEEVRAVRPQLPVLGRGPLLHAVVGRHLVLQLLLVLAVAVDVVVVVVVVVDLLVVLGWPPRPGLALARVKP